MATTPPVSPSPSQSSPPHERSHFSSASSPIPPPIPVETHPNRAGLSLNLKQLPLHQHSHSHSHSHSHPRSPTLHKQHSLPHEHAHTHQRLLPDPTRLAPEDAYDAHSSPQPRLRPPTHHHVTNHAASLRVPGTAASAVAVAALRPPPAVPVDGKAGKEHWGRRRRRKRQWKKLLWVKQSFPDNYTDTETFLDHLQRNPRLRPYDFWPLVADFTVIVQHVCSVVIFLCCFTAIFQERVSPVSVVSHGTLCTILGWVFWDFWVGKEHTQAARLALVAEGTGTDEDSSSSAPNGLAQGLGLALNDLEQPKSQQDMGDSGHSNGTCGTSVHSAQSTSVPVSPGIPYISYLSPTGTSTPSPSTSPSSSSSTSPRNRQRLATAKSGFLIFCALQGLSPILKSLTKSTTSDSIWAMSCWLMIINVFFFDYSTGRSSAAAKFPASLSTNAALMASTVLASRLKSTTHVFSLTLFSIEVFGLFPVFRRHLRAISWRGHVILTTALVITASAAVGTTLGGGYSGAILGAFIGGPTTAIVMGGCSWWLISLQKYKNVVTGPWDTAKPVLRRHWD